MGRSCLATLRRRVPLASALVLALLVLAACGEGGSGSPTAAPPMAYRFLFREFGREQDTFWSVLPWDPSQRRQVALIPHRAEWGVKASLSPDGRYLAYVTFPEGALDEGFQSDAYLLDLETGEKKLLAEGVDLHLRPLWSPDGQFLFLRRSLEQEVTVLQVDLTRPREDPDRIRTILQASVEDVATFIPIGFANDVLYFVQIESDGSTQVGAYALSTQQATPVIRLSEGRVARDYDLSPDSRRLAFLMQEPAQGKLRFRAFVADLATKSVAPLETDGLGGGDQLRPLWHPDGAHIAVGQLSSKGEPAAVALVPLAGGELSFLPAPAAGFDVPLVWAPDGSFLAVTSFEGGSGAGPDRTRLVLVAPHGQRLVVAEGADMEAIGWAKE